jgi:Terminase RNaseH-like domain/Terminase large subunit, T4likevirus-type, N-terminal
MSDTSYHGNPNLKPLAYEHTFTEEQIREVIKCKDDIIYFIKTYCYIVSLDHGLVLFEPYDCQKRKIKSIMDNRMVVVMEPRQNGKTITAAACILHYTLFGENKTVAILANKGASSREVLDRYQIMYENLPIWLQQGVKTWNKGDIELENGCKVFTAATTASGIRGKSINWLYIDEAAIIPNNIAEEFFASIYPTISSGSTTKILMTSTPLGYNHFWKFWNEAEKGKNGFVPMFIPYWEIPGRDEVWAEAQLKILGEVKFNQEVLCEFLGSSRTLISGRALSMMSSIDPIWASEDMKLQIYENPDPTRTYCVIVDTARGVGIDYSAFSVIDVTETPYRFVAKYRDNNIAPMLYPNVILKVAKDYNKAFVLIETNDIGGQIADILYSDLEYENLFCTVSESNKTYISAGFAKETTFGVRTTGTIKRIGCFALKSLIEEQKLLIFDAETIGELSTFIESKGSFAADVGYHDDLAMTLVLFGWLSTNDYFKDLTNVDIRKRLYEQQALQIEEDLTPFGFITSGIEEEETFLDNNVIWSTDKGYPQRWKDELHGG